MNNLITKHAITQFDFQAPDEYRVDGLLDTFASKLSIGFHKVSTEHFLSNRNDAARFFRDGKGKGKWLMERFYRHMRVKHAVLLDAEQKPVGGQWNYDKENRKKWKGEPAPPSDARPVHDHTALWDEISSQGITTMGHASAEDFRWPLNRAEALHVLDDFIDHKLPHFGDYQDAMHTDDSRLFHSLISFSLNVNMLSPAEVIAKAEQAYIARAYPLAAVEGFIRQILGWREFVRGFYWAHMPDMGQANFFGFDRPLPSWFWDGNTKMHCMKHAITQSLETAYAHHIQRLMVVGNFALLAGLNPDAVHQWYLGIYIDAFEWVEMPNTLSMSQYADGGLLATKPYVSSGAYMQNMSNYCSGCQYSQKTRIGENACPFNSLYWHFFDQQQTTLANNHRLGIVNKQLADMTAEDKAAIRAQATFYLDHIEQL